MFEFRSTEPSEQRELHKWIVMHMLTYAWEYRKKHGSWRILHLTPNLWLELDTWNQAIKIQYGEPKYNEFLGFQGKVLRYVGLNFGRFATPLTVSQYREIISLILEYHK